MAQRVSFVDDGGHISRLLASHTLNTHTLTGHWVKIKAWLSSLNSRGLYVRVSFGFSPPGLIRIRWQIDHSHKKGLIITGTERQETMAWEIGRDKGTWSGTDSVTMVLLVFVDVLAVNGWSEVEWAPWHRSEHLPSCPLHVRLCAWVNAGFGIDDGATIGLHNISVSDTHKHRNAISTQLEYFGGSSCPGPKRRPPVNPDRDREPVRKNTGWTHC